MPTANCARVASGLEPHRLQRGTSSQVEGFSRRGSAQAASHAGGAGVGFTRPYSCISPARRLLQGGLHRFHHQLDAARRRRTARVVSGRLDVGVEGDREGEGTAGGRLDQGDLAGEELALPGAAPRRSRQFSERLRASRRALSTSGPRRLPGRSTHRREGGGGLLHADPAAGRKMGLSRGLRSQARVPRPRNQPEADGPLPEALQRA